MNEDGRSASAISTGMVLVWSGIHALALSMGVSVVGHELYLATQLICGAVLLWAAWSAVSAGDAHGGAVPLMFGLSVLTRICGALSGDFNPSNDLRLPFVMPLAVSAVMMWADGMRARGLGTALLAGAMLSMTACEGLAGPLLIASGTAVTFSEFMHDAPPKDEPVRTCRILLAELVAVHAGMMLLSVGVVIGEVVGSVVSIAIALVSALSFGRGMVLPGCCGMVYSFTCLMTEIPFIDGSEAAATPVASVACMVIGAVAFAGKERLLGIGMAAFGAGLLLWTSTGWETAMIAGSCALAVLCIGEALRSWTLPEPDCLELEGIERIAAVSTAGMLVLALAVLSNAAGSPGIDGVNLAGCAFMFGFSMVAMRGRMLTEAMLFLMAGCYLFVYPLSNELEDRNGMLSMGVTLCIGFATAAYVYWRKDCPVRSAGCALLTLSLLIAGTGMTEKLHMVPAVAAGIAFLAVSLKKTVRFGITSDARIEERPNLVQSDNQYAVVLVMALCTVVLMMLALIGEIKDLMTIRNAPLEMFRLMLLGAILGFGLYSMRMGFTALGTYLLGSFLVCALAVALPMFGYRLPTELSLLSVAVFVPSVVAFIVAKNYIMTANSTMMLLSAVAGPFMGSSWGFDLFVLLFKAISGLIGLTLWIEYDSGRVIVPKYSRLWRRDLIPEGPERPVRPCILFSCLMLASLTAIWMAAAPLVPGSAETAFRISTASASILCMAMSACLFHAGSPDWGAFAMLLSIGVGAVCIPVANTDVWLALCLPLAVLTVLGLMRGSRAVPALCVATVAAFVLIDPYPVAGSIVLACVGAAMLALGSRGMITGESWVAPSELGRGWTLSMVGTVGLCICLFGTGGMLTASLIASAFILVAGFGLESHGMHAECLAVLSSSIPGFAFCASMLGGANLSAVPLVIPAALMGASALMFRARGRTAETAMCAVGTVLLATSIATGEWIPATIGCMMPCLAVVISGLQSVHGTEAGSPS